MPKIPKVQMMVLKFELQYLSRLFSYVSVLENQSSSIVVYLETNNFLINNKLLLIHIMKNITISIIQYILYLVQHSFHMIVFQLHI